MLLDAKIKLLLISLSSNTENLSVDKLKNYDFKGFIDNVLSTKTIPFPLEVDINNFSLNNVLKNLPLMNLVNIGNVITKLNKSLVINSTQKTSASGDKTLNNPLLDVDNDNPTEENSTLTQEPTGSQLSLEIMFEPKSKLPLILDSYLTAAASNVKDYIFSYISNELVVFNLVLGTFVTDATELNIITSITFIEKPAQKINKDTTINVKTLNQ